MKWDPLLRSFWTKWDPCLRIFGEKVTHLGSTSPYALTCEYQSLSQRQAVIWRRAVIKIIEGSPLCWRDAVISYLQRLDVVWSNRGRDLQTGSRHQLGTAFRCQGCLTVSRCYADAWVKGKQSLSKQVIIANKSTASRSCWRYHSRQRLFLLHSSYYFIKITQDAQRWTARRHNKTAKWTTKWLTITGVLLRVFYMNNTSPDMIIY